MVPVPIAMRSAQASFDPGGGGTAFGSGTIDATAGRGAPAGAAPRVTLPALPGALASKEKLKRVPHPSVFVFPPGAVKTIAEPCVTTAGQLLPASSSRSKKAALLAVTPTGSGTRKLLIS